MDICLPGAPGAPVLNAARAEASRRNGAKSRGPKSPEGKARSAQNALRHGFRAQAHNVLPGEDAAGFAALEAALIEELAPEGALQSVLVHRIACATWRLDRADRLEVEVFAHRSYGDAGPGLALIRDGNGTRSIETLMRYRGAAMAELMRALRALKALQAEQDATARAAERASVPMLEPKGRYTGSIEIAADQEAGEDHPHADPIEPEGVGNPDESKPAAAASEPSPHPRGPAHPTSEPCRVPAVALARLQRGPQPNEPAEAEAGAGSGAGRTAPGAIAPPRERRNLAAPAQPSFRSTP